MSACRSYFAALVPAEHSAEFFGFYNMMGKFAVIIGPAMMGGVGLAARRLLHDLGPPDLMPETAAQLAARISLASVVSLFVSGGLLFYFANRARARQLSGQGQSPVDRAL